MNSVCLHVKHSRYQLNAILFINRRRSDLYVKEYIGRIPNFFAVVPFGSTPSAVNLFSVRPETEREERLSKR
jgi:hypothetical protein